MDDVRDRRRARVTHLSSLSLFAGLSGRYARDREREREKYVALQSEPREHYGKRYASATYAKAQADTNLLGIPASITRGQNASGLISIDKTKYFER